MTGKQNAHLTHKGNTGIGRHGWLRLTPAYGVKLVRDIVSDLPRGAVVTDPFSGTGTTPLAAAEHGLYGQSLDVNPFLVWLGQTKTATYTDMDLKEARSILSRLTKSAALTLGDTALWQPRLFKIERWWGVSELAALRSIRSELDQLREAPSRDLLMIAFCRTLIGSSNAAFNHQSMSFKDTPDGVGKPFDIEVATMVLKQLEVDAEEVIASAAVNVSGTALVSLGDSRDMACDGLVPCDLLLTSPPYVNRMSYIRELRPYMYWLRYLDDASEAGELDWQAIGGTWGMATSRLKTWESPIRLPISDQIDAVCTQIAAAGGKNGPILSTYVDKYFADMWLHFQAAFDHVKSGGSASYIIGNSTFYGHVVPAEKWYEALLTEAGFIQTSITTIRKRNSKKELFEFDVRARRP